MDAVIHITRKKVGTRFRSPYYQLFLEWWVSFIMPLVGHLTAFFTLNAAMSTLLVGKRRAPSRHIRDARVYGLTTTAMHNLGTRHLSLLCAYLDVACSLVSQHIHPSDWHKRGCKCGRTLSAAAFFPPPKPDKKQPVHKRCASHHTMVVLAAAERLFPDVVVYFSSCPAGKYF